MIICIFAPHILINFLIKLSMKRISYLFMLVAAFSFAILSSCGGGAQTEGEGEQQEQTEADDQSAEAEESHEGHDHEGEAAQTTEELKPHVCSDKCSPESGCFFAHGEQGHTCTPECSAS